MVKLLNPPTPRIQNASNSHRLVNDLENRIHEETEQLLLDIRRISPTGEPYVLFGDLFDDDNVQQYYESLIGTLKSAKKRGCITFKGQMLLKGMSDKVQVSIVEQSISERNVESVALTARKEAVKASVANIPTQPLRLKIMEDKENKKSLFPPSANRVFTFSPKSIRREKKLTPRSGGACTDTEADDDSDVYGIGGWSDSEADLNIRRSPRRLTLPSIFLHDTRVAKKGGHPPAPWTLRRAVSSSVLVPKRTLKIQVIETPTNQDKQIGLLTAEEVLASTSVSMPVTKPVPTSTSVIISVKPARSSISIPAQEPLKPSSLVKPKRDFNTPTRHQSLPVVRGTLSAQKSAEIESMVDEEVIRLLVDIRRLGLNPGEPTVTFGELFDDELVQNSYEALVGTLRSAKRQGKIHFLGQMLLKGVHDDVVISVVEDANTL